MLMLGMGIRLGASRCEWDPVRVESGESGCNTRGPSTAFMRHDCWVSTVFAAHLHGDETEYWTGRREVGWVSGPGGGK
jgi:hypothetical protein